MILLEFIRLCSGRFPNIMYIKVQPLAPAMYSQDFLACEKKRLPKLQMLKCRILCTPCMAEPASPQHTSSDDALPKPRATQATPR